jgi:hypothetical protein
MPDVLSVRIEGMRTTADISNPAFWKEEAIRMSCLRGEQQERLGRRGGDAHRSGHGTPAHIVRCKECHLVYAYPHAQAHQEIPTPRMKARSTLPATKPMPSWRMGGGWWPGRNSCWGARVGMLELGCGRGELLGVAAERGWAVAGVEMTPQFALAAAARGIDHRNFVRGGLGPSRHEGLV